MKIIEPGHIYELHSLDGKPGEYEILRYVNREEGSEHPGTQSQEVLRTLIDRTMHCDNCLRWHSNDKIIYHLRMALALHESRAIERKAEKGYYAPERMKIGADGHFTLTDSNVCDTDAAIYEAKPKTSPLVSGEPVFCTRD
jgi:hypothetical protein